MLWRCWLGGRKGIRPVKNRVVGYWCGYLSGARCRLAYGPADATHSLSLAPVKSRLFLPFWYPLTQVVLEKRPLNGSSKVRTEWGKFAAFVAHPEAKRFSASGGFASLIPWLGAQPLDPAGGSTDPRYRLALAMPGTQSPLPQTWYSGLIVDKYAMVWYVRLSAMLTYKMQLQFHE